MSRRMTPEELQAFGLMVLGKQWQHELSRRIGVGDRTVRGWLSGESEIPGHVPQTLLGVIEMRHTELDRAAAQIKELIEYSPLLEALQKAREGKG